ncbi:hypothetical protein SteCoe_715 [Stentor coeruleus]|uniref:Transmembrane protein 131-like N-terminal domain-containing protein n=1 Tax=Stentor coeruleus TaxID=5963 RepID=A0A1R2D3H4_9CILI|nr:hypothetical protein SteCoe_715 [Stentor coeruleus]
MGIYRLSSLIIYFFLEAYLALSSEIRQSKDQNFSALTSLILALNPALSKFISQKLVFVPVSISPTKPTLLYSESYVSVSLQTANDYFIFQFLSISSNEFRLKEPPLLYYKYPKPYVLDIYFLPNKTGIRTAYFFVVTEQEVFVYYMQGIVEMPKFGFEEIVVEYGFGDCGIGVLKIENFCNESLEVGVKKTFPSADSKMWQTAIEYSKYIELKENNITLTPLSITEIPIIESLISIPGEYSTTLLLLMDSISFYIPINIKVIDSKINCPSNLHLGLLTVETEFYSFSITCKVLSNEIVTLNSWSINGPEIFKPGFSQIDNLIFIGNIFIIPKNEGNFIRKLVLETNFGPVSIMFSYIVAFNAVFISSDDMKIQKPHNSSVNLCFQNKLNHDIWIDKFESLNTELTISNYDKIAIPQGLGCFSGKIRNDRSHNLYIKASTSIGDIILPLHILDPIPIFLLKTSHKLKKILGPLDLGVIGYGVPLNKTLCIKNPYKFPITIYTIHLISIITTKFYKSHTINPSEILDIPLQIKPEFSIFNPIKIQTSIGNFSLTVHMSAIPGSCKAKNTQVIDLMPQIPIEEPIIVINSFQVPVKILSFKTNSEVFTITRLVDEIPANKQIVIGKLIALIDRPEKPRIDFKKSLTYRDIKMWNLYTNSYNEAFVTTDIILHTNVGGYTKSSAFANVIKPQLPFFLQSQTSTCEIFSICPINIWVKNPLNIPLAIQIQVAPDNFSKTLENLDCHNTKHEASDDEFENLSYEYIGSISQECLTTSNEEVLIVKKANERKLDLSLKSIKTLGLYDKLKVFFIETINEKNDKQNICGSNCEDCIGYCDKQSLYINDRIYTIIPAQSSKILGPVYFNPTSLGQVYPLIIRNNYTYLEMFTLNMNIDFNQLAVMKRSIYYYSPLGYFLYKNHVHKTLKKEYFLSQISSKLIEEYIELHVDISAEEMSRFYIENSSMLSPVFYRTFDLQNIGSRDIEINSILLENQYCSISPCGNDFLLKPSEYFTIEISYSLAEMAKSSYLYIKTDSKTLIFPIEVMHNDLTYLNCYIYKYTKELYGAAFSTICALILTTFNHHYTHKSFKLKSKSSKDYCLFIYQQYFYKKYSQPIFLNKQQNNSFMPTQKNIENLLTPTPPIVQNIISHDNPIDQNLKIKKKQKIKRRLTTIVQSTEDRIVMKKKIQTQPDIIANNKLLMGKVVNNIELSHSTSLTENGEREIHSDDDFYIDYYKTSNLMFAGYSSHESCSLAELTQDSEPCS